MSFLFKSLKDRSCLIHLCTLLTFTFFGQRGLAQLPTNNPKAPRNLLPNGWSLSPAGRSLPLGDLPMNMALSHAKNLLAVTNNGVSRQEIHLIDPVGEKLIDKMTIKRSWYGLRFSEDDKILYVSGGNDNMVLAYAIENDKIGKADTFVLGKPWPAMHISVTGLDIDTRASRLYTVTREDNSLYISNLKSKAVIRKIDLKDAAYSCVLSPDRSHLYISLWGADKLAVFNTRTGQIDKEIATEGHPNEILINKSGKILYVANADDNSVSVINTLTNKVIETISATLYPTHLIGSTTNGLALSQDEKTLYIANADNDCLAVFNVSKPGKSTSRGFIPTGWYPTNVKTVGAKIIVSNGKGFSSLANPRGPQPQPVLKNDTGVVHQEIGGNRGIQKVRDMLKGTLSFIDEPDDKQMEIYSNQVYENTPYNPKREKLADGEEGNPIPRKMGERSPIKHVFYVIKENRTYDQVLGDMKEGNGDSSLCLFKERITPNAHALARQFVLLDNFYVDAEVSADGHKWSTGAYATDYIEKTWPTNNSERGQDWGKSRYMAYPKNGYIWDYCKRAGISYRTYGELGLVTTMIPVLKGHVASAFRTIDMNVRDVDRMKVFKRDFDSLLAINKVPALNTIRLSNDHTVGQRLGKLSPFSMVADNDLALGELVEYISNSKIWKESAIFVLEDDAQNGPDHVDAHRSPAFVISPYIKMGSVNSHMYSTSGMLRTIELILGLPPMSQYDAAALPFFDCFTSKPDFRAYTLRQARVSLDQVNVAHNKSSERSSHFDFSKEDAAPDRDLNEVIWKFAKGEASEMPAPRHSAFVKLEPRSRDAE